MRHMIIGFAAGLALAATIAAAPAGSSESPHAVSGGRLVPVGAREDGAAHATSGGSAEGTTSGGPLPAALPEVVRRAVPLPETCGRIRPVGTARRASR